MTLNGPCWVLLKNLFFAKQIDFLLPLLSFCLALLLWLPFAMHILSGCRKKLGVNHEQSLEMGPWSIIGITGRFTTIFAPKLITLFFNLLRQNAVDIQNRWCADRPILALLSAYQEYLLTLQLMTSQVVQGARPLRTGIYVLGGQKVFKLRSFIKRNFLYTLSSL